MAVYGVLVPEPESRRALSTRKASRKAASLWRPRLLLQTYLPYMAQASFSRNRLDIGDQLGESLAVHDLLLDQ